MQVLILASGRTIKEGGFPPDSKPKCLFNINGETVLGRQLRILHKFFTDDQIFIVVNYKKEMIKEFCQTQGYNINFIEIEDINDPIADFKAGLSHITEDLLFIVGDYCFEGDITLEAFITNPKPFVVFAHSTEIYMMKVSKELIPELYKVDQIDTKRAVGWKPLEFGGDRLILRLWGLAKVKRAKVYRLVMDIDLYWQTDEGVAAGYTEQKWQKEWKNKCKY